MTVVSDGPSAATSAIANRISGKAIIASIRRAIGASSFWKNPARRPRVTPISDASTTTAKPTSSDSRAEKIVRENTSRPNSSVPKNHFMLGGFSRLTMDSLLGE